MCSYYFGDLNKPHDLISPRFTNKRRDWIMEKAAAAAAAGEDAIADERDKATPSSSVVGAPPPKKCKTAAVVDAGASGAARSVPDDVVRNILARLPARTAVACTALSKHHGGLIRGPEFRSLHRRLGAPLPRPHIAYVATAPVWRRPDQKNPSSRFYGFHVAAGAGRLGYDGPMRTLAGCRYLGTRYVNTCNGVVLIASDGFCDVCRCTLWNPAVADPAREVTVAKQSPESKPLGNPAVADVATGVTRVVEEWPQSNKCLVLGLGYGRRSKTYKMLLCRKDRHRILEYLVVPGRKNRNRITGGPTHRIEYSLVVQVLGDDAEKRIPLPIVSSVMEVNESMKQKSLYFDGTIYLHLEESAILAFDVDDETVSRIDMPAGEGRIELIEMSGRPCMVRIAGCCIELWLLTVDHEWEQMCVIADEDDISIGLSTIGVWHCSGVLVLHFLQWSSFDEIWLYDVAAKKVSKAYMPDELVVERSDYELAWGYKPTLVSPESIVGGISQELERRRSRSARIMEVTNPLSEHDRRKGQEATLNTVCLMEFLVRIMQKLPDDMQDVLEMPTMDSDDPDFLFDESVTC